MPTTKSQSFDAAGCPTPRTIGRVVYKMIYQKTFVSTFLDDENLPKRVMITIEASGQITIAVGEERATIPEAWYKNMTIMVAIIYYLYRQQLSSDKVFLTRNIYMD